MFKRVNKMEKEITYRHNIMNINSLDTFLSIKGGFHAGKRDVYFVRALGCRPDMEEQILAIDRRMGSEMQKKRLFYTRTRLPSPLISQEDMYFYSSQFETLKEEQKLSVRNQEQDGWFSRVLGAACTETIEKYRLARKDMTESIEKNFVIKLLYWTDCVLGRALADWDERKCFKILAEDVQKEQEYLFCYMLTLLGCDVLLLECRKDISTTDVLKGLSAEFRNGEFKDTLRLPEYSPCEASSAMQSVHEMQTIQAEREEVFADSLRSGEGKEIKGQTGLEGRAAGSKERESGAVQAPGGPVRVFIPERPGRRHSGAHNQTESQQQTWRQTESQPQMQVQSTRQQGRRQTESQPQMQVQSTRQQGRRQSESQPQMHIQQQTQSRMDSQPGQQPRTPLQSRPQIPPQAGTPSQPQFQPQLRQQPAVPGSPAGNPEKSFEELALLASSIVMIAVYNRAGEPIATGSGIMIGRDGYILTNNHVTRGGCFFAVRIEDDENIYKTNEIIKYNTVLDLAVIRIDRRLHPLPLYKGRKLVRGQKVVAIGSPLGMFNSVSDGIISGFREIDSVDMIQFTAPISHGSSGGALLNMQGEVIGISTAGIDEGQNINLAVSYEDIGMFVRGFMN